MVATASPRLGLTNAVRALFFEKGRVHGQLWRSIVSQGRERDEGKEGEGLRRGLDDGDDVVEVLSSSEGSEAAASPLSMGSLPPDASDASFVTSGSESSFSSDDSLCDGLNSNNVKKSSRGGSRGKQRRRKVKDRRFPRTRALRS